MESDELNEMEVTRGEVLDSVGKLNINVSLGPDGIHARVLKELRSEIADHLTKMCRLLSQSLCQRTGKESV